MSTTPTPTPTGTTPTSTSPATGTSGTTTPTSGTPTSTTPTATTTTPTTTGTYTTTPPANPLGLVTINFSFSVVGAVLLDFDWYWRQQGGVAAKLTAAIGASDTTLLVNQIQAAAVTTTMIAPLGSPTVTTPASLIIAPNSCITVDDEPMIVASVTAVPDTNGNYTVTVTRGQSQTVNGAAIVFPKADMVSHPTGAPVSVLQYVSPWEFLRLQAFAPIAQKAVTARGMSSAIFTSIASGTIS